MKLIFRQIVLVSFLKENVKFQERLFVFLFENVNKKSSCLQISLQLIRYSGCFSFSNVLVDGDDVLFVCVLKDGIYSIVVVDNELNVVNDGNFLGSFVIRSGSFSNFLVSENGFYSSNGSDYGLCISIISGGLYINSIFSDSSGYIFILIDDIFFGGNLFFDSIFNRSVLNRNIILCEIFLRSISIVLFVQDDLEYGLEIMKLLVSRNSKILLKRCLFLVIFFRSFLNILLIFLINIGIFLNKGFY